MLDQEEFEPLDFREEESKDEDEYVEDPRSPRFTQWFAFFLFSIITLGSAIEASEPTDDAKLVRNQKWAVVCSCMTFGITMCVLILHMYPLTAIFIVSTKLEGFIICLLISFWAATAEIVSNSENGLSVNGSGAVVFGNLYYFSWAGFVCSITLFVSYLRSVYHIDMAEELRARSKRLILWTLLMVFCMIMMGSSANILDEICIGDDKATSYCKRTDFAVVISTMGVILSLIMMGLKISIVSPPFWFEQISSVVLFLSFAVGVAFITSEQGPGAPLGNIYYSTWAAFVCSFFVCLGVFEEWNEAKIKMKKEYDEEQDDFNMQEELEDYSYQDDDAETQGDYRSVV